MKRTYTLEKRVLAMLLCFAMLAAYLPGTVFRATAAGTDNRVTDPHTLDQWQKYFGLMDGSYNDVALTTEYAGGVWTDKSVFTPAGLPTQLTTPSYAGEGIRIADQGDNFVVALSAMASNKEVVGYSTVPTDTIMVLDLSSSMQSNDDNGGSAVDELVEATNAAITELLKLNKNNRVAVVLFAGNTSGNFNNNPGATTVVLPLDTYTPAADGTFLESTTVNGNPDYGIRIKNGVKGSSGAVTGNMNTSRGTFTQDGIYEAMKLFLNVSDTKVETGIQAGTDRLPIMVLMTDGEPTMASHDYNGNNAGTDLGNSSVYLQFNGRDYNHRDTIAWLTQLTAAYAKREISQHYGTDALFYTLAFGEESDSLAEAKSVMDPAQTSEALNGFWNDFLAGRAVTVFTYRQNNQNRTLTTSNDTAEPLVAADKLYVDKPFKADGTTGANGLYNVFAEIVNEIIVQSKYYPTYVEKDHDHDGYLTMVDKIGAGMEVTDIGGIIIGDRLFSGEAISRAFIDGTFGSISSPNARGHALVDSVRERLGITDTAVAQTLLQNAYDHGQLAYNAANDTFSHYIGWFSDANGNYLDFWHENMTEEQTPTGATHIIKSYGFLGDTTVVSGISDTDMMYMSVRVSTEIASGESIVTWRIPASLVPTVTYEVEVEVTDEGEITDLLDINLSADSAQTPIRLVYEVALKDGIYDWNVAQKGQRASTGDYVFYTNKWNADAETTTENTYSHFEPSVENERYYYTQKTTVLVKNGENYTPYTGAKPSGDGYFRSYLCFEKLTNGSLRSHLHYEEISAQAMESVEQDGTNWVIPKGIVHRYYDYEITNKVTNATGTMAHSDHPFIVKEAEHYYTYSTQGNNGKLTMTPATGIKLTKTLAAGYVSNAAFTFQVTGDITNAELVRLTAAGEEASRTALSADGKFTLTAGETVYVLGLTGSYTISEVIPADADYTVSRIQVGTTDHNGTSVDLTVTDRTITDVTFTNDTRGTGNLYITKEIVSDHDLPASVANQTFRVEVFVGAALSGKTFTVKHGDVEQNAVVNDQGYLKIAGEDLQIPRDVAYEILDLPTGTQVIVRELLTDAQDDYFTAAIRSRDHTGATQENDNAVIIHKDANATAVITNTYKPVPVAVDLEINGTKSFIVDSPLGAPLDFDFAVQRWNGVTWQPVDQKTATVSSTGGVHNFSISNVLEKEDYDKVGAYAYRVVEVIPENREDGVVYDRTAYTFTVTVTDVDGSLQAAVTDHDGAAVNGSYAVSFTNRYHSAPVSVDVQKTVVNVADNPNATAAGFTFIATETDSTFTTEKATYSEVTDGAGHIRFAGVYDVAGDYYFTVRESIPAAAQPVSSGTYAGKYHLDGWYFDPTVYYIHVSVTEQGGDFKAVITYGTDPLNLTGTTDNARLAFTNTYAPAQAQVDLDVVPTVLKTITGRPLENGEFTFYVTENNNRSNILLTGTNDVAGNVNFNGTLKLSAIGTYHYDVVEKQENKGGVTYDKTVFDMVVEVTDNGDGTLSARYYFEDSLTNQVTFRNTYTSDSVEHAITATKYLSGRPLLNGEFSFKLEEAIDAQGTLKSGGLVLTAENGPATGDNAQVYFPKQVYTTPGTYFYKLTEIPGAQNIGISYSAESYVYKVVVEDNNRGALEVKEAAIVSYSEANGSLPTEITFTNTYRALAGTAGFDGKKELTGRVLGNGEFTFILTETESDFVTPVTGGYTATVKNTAEGKVSFGTVEYDKEDTHYYLIREDASAALGGITYDSSQYLVTVVVTDNHTGKLVPSVTIQKKTFDEGSEVVQPASSIVFQNYYAVEPDVLEIVGSKQYTDSTTNQSKTMDADLFTFKLEGNGQELFAKNNAAGEFKFQLFYTAADIGNEYTYTISEVAGDKTYITYDQDTFTLKVKIKDNGEGGLKITKVITTGQTEVQNVSFENSYNPASVNYYPAVTKRYEGEAMRTFDFVLSGAGFPSQTKQNDTQGNVEFDKLTFTKAGTYEFTIAEQENALWGFIKWDTNVYTVKVIVEDRNVGQLEIADVQITSVKGRSDLIFLNAHEDAIGKKEATLVSANKVLITGEKVEANDVLEFTISYTNYTGMITDVTIVDTIPQYTTYVDGSAGNATHNGNTLTWNISNIAPEETVTVSFRVKVQETGGEIKNQAQILEGNHTYYTNETVNPFTEDEVKKEVSLATAAGISIDGQKVEVGQILEYAITYKNADDADATVTIEDTIPQYTTYVDGSATHNGSYAAGKLTWIVPVSANSSETVKFRVKVDAPEVFIDNQASAMEGENSYQTNPVSNHTYEEVGGKDVSLVGQPNISVDGQMVQVGQILAYTIDYTNITDGPVDVTITDVIPAHTKLHQSGNATVSGDTLTWTFNAIAPRETKTVTFQVEVTDPGAVIENQAQIFDGTNKLTNKVTNSTPVKTVSKQEASLGEILTYSVSYTNQTGAPAKLVITDQLSQALTYVEGSAGAGVHDNGVITWTVENVPAGETVTVTFQAKITSDTQEVTNKAQIIENTVNAVFTNETVSKVHKADLQIKKEQVLGSGSATTEKLTAKAGDKVTYILTVTNNGQGDAYGVKVADKIPEGLTYVEASADNGGIVKDGVISWTLDTLAAGSSVKLSFTVTVPGVEKDTLWTNVATFVYENNPEGEEEVTESNKVDLGQTPPPATPKTGDSFNPGLFIGVMTLSSLALAVLVVCKKREENANA